MSKTVIYQVLPRLFGNMQSANQYNGTLEVNGSGKLNGINSKVLNHFKKMGISHMWYTGVIEHATTTDYSDFGIVKDKAHVVKGLAGSPYAIKDYYDIDPDLATDVDKRLEEFDNLVKRTHDAGLKVIIDFIPNHLARQYSSDAKPEGIKDFGEDDDQSQSFIASNNYYYLPNTDFKAPGDHTDDPWQEIPARATGNDCFSPNPDITDWFETVKLNYGVDIQNNRQNNFDPIPDTWHKMKDVLWYWASKGVDGFRCDMAEMVPVEFWQWCIAELKKEYSELLFVAEVYQPDLYQAYLQHGGFDLLYDKVGFYDSVIDVLKDHRPMHVISDAWHRIDSFSSNMLFFLENHDELRLASDYICGNAHSAWPAWVLTAAYSSNPIMIYAGQEIGEPGMDEEGFSGRDGRTTIFDYWSVDSLRRYYDSINKGESELSDSESHLLNNYQKITSLLNQNKPLSEGGVYDLMWCNKESGGLEQSKVYAWLRYHEKEWLLLVANFSDQDKKTRVIIPEHALGIIGVDNKNYYKGKEIMEGARPISFPKEVACTKGVGLSIKAHQVLIYQF